MLLSFVLFSPNHVAGFFYLQCNPEIEIQEKRKLVLNFLMDMVRVSRHVEIYVKYSENPLDNMIDLMCWK